MKTYLQEMPRTNYLNTLFKPTEGDYASVPGRKKKRKKGELNQSIGL